MKILGITIRKLEFQLHLYSFFQLACGAANSDVVTSQSVGTFLPHPIWFMQQTAGKSPHGRCCRDWMEPSQAYLKRTVAFLWGLAAQYHTGERKMTQSVVVEQRGRCMVGHVIALYLTQKLHWDTEMGSSVWIFCIWLSLRKVPHSFSLSGSSMCLIIPCVPEFCAIGICCLLPQIFCRLMPSHWALTPVYVRMCWYLKGNVIFSFCICKWMHSFPRLVVDRECRSQCNLQFQDFISKQIPTREKQQCSSLHWI